MEAVEAIDKAEASPRPGMEDFEDSVSSDSSGQDMSRHDTKRRLPP